MSGHITPATVMPQRGWRHRRRLRSPGVGGATVAADRPLTPAGAHRHASGVHRPVSDSTVSPTPTRIQFPSRSTRQRFRPTRFLRTVAATSISSVYPVSRRRVATQKTLCVLSPSSALPCHDSRCSRTVSQAFTRRTRCHPLLVYGDDEPCQKAGRQLNATTQGEKTGNRSEQQRVRGA